MVAPIALPGSGAQPLLRAPTLWALFQRRAQLTPDALMAIDGQTGQRMSFGQALHIATRLAAGLYSRGVGTGTLVTWMLPTGLTALMTSLALSRLGAVQNPVIPHGDDDRLHRLLVCNGADVLLVPGAGSHDYPVVAAGLCAKLPAPPRVIVMAGDLPQGRPSILPPGPEEGEPARWLYFDSGRDLELVPIWHTDQSLMQGGRDLALATATGSENPVTLAVPYAHIDGILNMCMLLASGIGAVFVDTRP